MYGYLDALDCFFDLLSHGQARHVLVPCIAILRDSALRSGTGTAKMEVPRRFALISRGMIFAATS